MNEQQIRLLLVLVPDSKSRPMIRRIDPEYSCEELPPGNLNDEGGKDQRGNRWL